MTTRVLWHDSISSTQDEAHRLAEAGAPHGTAVAARVQTAGRGTRGRAWDSGAGGLWLSVVARPAGVAAVEVTGIRVGLAVAAMLAELRGLGEPLWIKWPNDLYARDRKLGGFLVEARWQGDRLGWMVIGVGINARNTVAAGHRGAAIGLGDLLAGVALDELAGEVAAVIAAAALCEGPLTPGELEVFHRHDWLRGRLVAAPVEGVAEGISPLGRLRVRRADGMVQETLDSITLLGGAA